MAEEPKNLSLNLADTASSTATNGVPKVKTLIRKHPDYADLNAGAKRWDLLTRLVAGGSKVTVDIKKELLQNPDKRPKPIVEERAKIATYANVLGSTINRVNTQLFQEEAAYEGNEKDDFWKEFLGNSAFILDADDDAKAGFSLGLKDAMLAALTCGQAIAEISTNFTGTAVNLKQQIDNGELDPYVVLLPRTALWDWQTSARGFEFVKIHRYRVDRENWAAEPVPVHSFTIYQRDPNSDRISISQYEMRPNPLNPAYKTNPTLFNIETLKEPEVVVSVVTIGGKAYENIDVFNLNGKYDFPIKTLTIPPNLCIGDQLFDLARENFNIRAGIDWKMHSVLFSMPVLTLPNGTDDVSDVIAQGQKFGDGYMLCLPYGASITSLELGGGGIAIALSLLEKNKTDILEQLQQIASTAASSTSGLGRSADKTREDKKPEVIMLEVLGMYVRLFADQILDCCAIARGEDTDWNVNGFKNYLGDGVTEMIADIAGMLSVGINTPTLRKESMEKTATSFGKKYNVSPEKMAKIIEEIQTTEEKDLDLPVALPVPPSPQQEGADTDQPLNDSQSATGDVPPVNSKKQDAALEAIAMDVLV